MTSRYFYDTEFLENGETIELISIGIAAEDGREYYAVNSAVGESLNESDLGKRIAAHDWLMTNVVPHLPLRGDVKRYNGVPSNKWMPPPLNMRSTLVKPAWVIANEVREFITGDAIELWADYCAYDHVVLMQLYGTMIARPPQFPMFTHDIQAYANFAGFHDLPDIPEGEAHNALTDARNVWERYSAIRVHDRHYPPIPGE